ncbi:predicted protein [Aspergillus udagawae]|uniref:Uncharacterized protein n=1 Tax=Aspergillus udagawae TaxID=91492 RepID=A0ABQ1B8Y5_9EURO|nr:predicted protein [Aspergillus udagawae]
MDHPEWPANNAVRPGETPNSESENKEFTYWRRGMDHPEWPANNAVRPGETPNSESENKDFTYWKEDSQIYDEETRPDCLRDHRFHSER